MKFKNILGFVCIGSVCAFADYFVWPAQNLNQVAPTQKSASTQDPNIGYYVDARTNKVVGLVDINKGSHTTVDIDASNNLKIGNKNNQVKLKGAETEEFKIKEEVIQLW